MGSRLPQVSLRLTATHWRGFDRLPPGPTARRRQCLSDMTATGFRIRAPDLKHVPAGFDKTHTRSVFLRNKRVSVWTNPLNPKVATRSDLVVRRHQDISAMMPLVHKLDAPQSVR